MNYINIISFLISLILSYIGAPMILDMLKRSETTRLNYKKENIPISMGILFIFVQFISLSIVILFKPIYLQYIMLYLFAITLIGLIGLLDDLTGDENVKGFKGHIKSFFNGELTTGGMKAGVGFLISLFISIVICDNLAHTLVNIMLIALFTNFTNLFDLRPGRALKVFILVSIIMLFSAQVNEYSFILYSFYGILIIYLPMDLRGLAMMGDVGSNVLGITLGIYCGYTHSLVGKIAYLIFLIIIHIMAEKISFSQVIEKNKALNFIDRLGR